jgi:hypothetical protein
MNLFEEFLNEEIKHVNNDVVHYTSDLVSIIEKNGFFIDINRKESLTNRDVLKLEFQLIVKINPSNFNNYGYFKTTSQSKIEGDILTNCIIYLEMNLTDSEMKFGKISPLNPVRRLINHELNHALEIYQYEFNSKRWRNSWELSKKQQKHRDFSKDWKYWSDFIHLIYLGLNHEMSSRISSIYEDLKLSKNPDVDLLSNKIYLDAKFMSEFNFHKFYELFINKYSESDFIKLCEVFCQDFDYQFKSDLKFCQNLIKRIIKSLNKKGDKIIHKLNGVVKRINQENYPNHLNNEGFYDKHINYKDYE